MQSNKYLVKIAELLSDESQREVAQTMVAAGIGLAAQKGVESRLEKYHGKISKPVYWGSLLATMAGADYATVKAVKAMEPKPVEK
jgi:hypothetical protein